LSPVLRDLQREHGVRLRVIGDETFGIEGAEVEALPWREHTELEDLRQIDIGIMPLPDNQWTRGKCGVKPMQYMALGIPAVLSPIGVNRDIARDGAAVLAETDGDWKEALKQLIVDSAMREQLGRSGRRRMVDEYSVHANVSRYVDALREAAEL
jgi:glycosyltransferase involved in cell wall biosynthesis